MKQKLIIYFLIGLFLVGFASAGSFDFVVRPLSLGNLVLNSPFDYTINFTSDSACSNVLLSSNATTRTDDYGVGNFTIDISGLVTPPSFFCEYRNGVLRKTHNVSDVFADRVLAKSGIVSGNLNVSGNVTTDVLFFNHGSKFTINVTGVNPVWTTTSNDVDGLFYNHSLSSVYYSYYGGTIIPYVQNLLNGDITSIGDINAKNINLSGNLSVNNIESSGNISTTNVSLNKIVPQGGRWVYIGEGFQYDDLNGFICIGNNSAYDCSSILEVVGNPGANPFYTVTRWDNTTNMGFAFGESGGMDLWDLLVPLNSNDLVLSNIRSGGIAFRINATSNQASFYKGWTGNYNSTKTSDGSQCTVYVSGGIITNSTNC
jgi:hypothetical protein